MQDGTSISSTRSCSPFGRRPNTSGLGLEHCGVELDGARAVKVDAHSRSTQPNIYAVGDVTDPRELDAIAIREGAAFAERSTKQAAARRPYRHPDRGLGTPEIGVVGLTEEVPAPVFQGRRLPHRLPPMRAT